MHTVQKINMSAVTTDYLSFLMLSTLGKNFSRRQIYDIFLIFPRKQDLTFHANCLNLHKKSNSVFREK